MASLIDSSESNPWNCKPKFCKAAFNTLISSCNRLATAALSLHFNKFSQEAIKSNKNKWRKKVKINFYDRFLDESKNEVRLLVNYRSKIQFLFFILNWCVQFLSPLAFLLPIPISANFFPNAFLNFVFFLSASWENFSYLCLFFLKFSYQLEYWVILSLELSINFIAFTTSLRNLVSFLSI